MAFNVHIKTDNAAFADGMAEAEVARILRKVADQLEAGLHFYEDRSEGGVALRDANGNTVGHAAFDQVDPVTIEAAIVKAREIGADHGRSAAGWWEQDAIGGRATGDVRPTARAVLQGLEDGDPQVLDAIPGPDLSGEWADGYSPRRLLDDVGANDGDASFIDGLVSDLCDAYEKGFSETCEAAIVAACRLVLED